MADAVDSKFTEGNLVGVQVPPPAPFFLIIVKGQTATEPALKHSAVNIKKTKKEYSGWAIAWNLTAEC